MSEAYLGTLALLDRHVPFSAIFTISDTMALAVVKALHDRGLRVPDDYSVIGIDGLSMSQFFVPTLTTMAQPTQELGRESVAILMDMVQEGLPPRHKRLLATLRPGSSIRSL